MDLSTIAREAAFHCEAKLCAFRKTEKGTVVSFVLHHSEVPEQLATANIGTRIMLAMVELDDNERPKK